MKTGSKSCLMFDKPGWYTPDEAWKLACDFIGENRQSMFEDLWNYVENNCKVLAQNKTEMEHVYNLIIGCESYLEIGTSEGNSLYVFGHAMKSGSEITYVDAAENHTREWREGKIAALLLDDYKITGIHGNSHHKDSVEAAQKKRYDVVFIDAGHTYSDVLQDANNYGPLADKYILFHDVQIPQVMEAYKDWLAETGRTGELVINSDKYGYAIVKVNGVKK